MVAVYTAGAIPPLLLVCVGELMPKGTAGDQLIVYAGVDGGLKLRLRLKALNVLVQLLCVVVGAETG